MSTYAGRHSPQGQYNIAGKRHDNVYTRAQHGVVPGRREGGVDRPFPNKPVSHRRPINPRTQQSLDLCDFEKITITKQPRGPLSPQEHQPNGIRETTESEYPRKDSHRLPRRELQMAKAIHAKELILQEKLWKVEDKIRQKIQRDSDQTSEEERHGRGQAERGKAPTKTKLSEPERKEPVRSRDMIMQERRQVDVKQLSKTHDQSNEDRMRNTREEGMDRQKRREIEVAQSQRKGRVGSHETTVHEQEVSGELNKSRWENVKEHTRRKGGDEKDDGIWGGTSVRSQGDKGWTREKKYRERTCRETYGSDSEREMPQMSQQKSSHRAATENHRGAGRKLSGEPLLPPLCSPSHSSRPEQKELRLIDTTDTSRQLLPCSICNRKFASDRLEKHSQICKKTKQSHRHVFNSYVHRTKGSANEEFLKTHSRAKTPEVLKKKNPRQNHKANTRNLQEGQLPAGTSQVKRLK